MELTIHTIQSASLNNKMTYEVYNYYSKDKTINSTHVKTIIKQRQSLILAIYIHSTLATLHPLQL